MRKNTPRVCIVGAGAAGLALAYALSLRGINSLICDAGMAGQGALSASAGMIAPAAEMWEMRVRAHPLGRAFAALARHSVSLWPDWAGRLRAETGMDTGYTPCGSLLPGNTPAQLQQLAAMGVDAVAWDAGVALARLPGINLQGGATFLPGDAQLSAPWLARALMAALARRGVDLRENVRVTALKRAGDVWRVTLASGEVVEADYAVLAAGWTAADLHVAAADVFPVKGQAVMLDAGNELDWPLVRAGDVYFAAKPGGRLLVGASVEPGKSDSATDPDAARMLIDRAAGYLPAIGAMPRLAHWAGVRPALPGMMPRAGLAETGLVVALGAYRHGVMLAPALAEGLAMLIDEGRADERVVPFAPVTVNEGLSSGG